MSLQLVFSLGAPVARAQGVPVDAEVLEHRHDETRPALTTALTDEDRWSRAAAESNWQTPLSGPTAASTEVSSQAISLPRGAGKIDGMGDSFGANLSTGAATLEIPLALPAGRGDVSVGLGLRYSSGNGHGLAGVGWSFGTPAITRQTSRGRPDYDDRPDWHSGQDHFLYGRDELVPICTVSGGACGGALPGEVMPGWANGWQYFRAENGANDHRLFWSADHRTWRVQIPSGRTLEFGVPLDGSSHGGGLEVDPDDASRIFGWSLTRAFDGQGGVAAPVNVVLYRYTSVEGLNYLSDVYWTPPVATGVSAPSAWAHHARVRYEPRSDPTTSYRRGWRVRSSLRITGVDVASARFTGGSAREMLRRYHLTYAEGTHVSLLESVQMEGRCSSPIVEQGEALPDQTGCPRMPPAR